MKTIKSTSVLGRNFLAAYRLSRITDLTQAYACPSRVKWLAFNKCIDDYLCDVFAEPYSYCIISYNTFHFTFAYMRKDGHLVVITKTNEYEVF